MIPGNPSRHPPLDDRAAQPHPLRCVSKIAHRILLVLGVLCLAAAPLIIIGAGAYTYFQPRLYTSFTEFDLLFPAVDGLELAADFKQAQKDFPTKMKEPLTARVSLRPAGPPDRFQITATDKDPQNAANTANMLTISIMDAQVARSHADERRAHVLLKGVRALEPSSPDVRLIMTCGMVSAALCGVTGGALLLMVLFRRDSRGAVPPPPPA